MFSVLRRGKAVRGTLFDLFGYQAERKAERAAIEQYIADLRSHRVGGIAVPETLETPVSLAALPDGARVRTGEGQRTGEGWNTAAKLLAALADRPVPR